MESGGSAEGLGQSRRSGEGTDGGAKMEQRGNDDVVIDEEGKNVVTLLNNETKQPYFGGAYELGGKMTQEDYIVCVGDMNQYIPPNSSQNSVKRSFCAVFDGHGGENVSKYLATHFHLKLARHPKFCAQPLTALQETWQQMEQDLKVFCASGNTILKDGSTATVCLIVGGSVYIANCGDSSGYLQMSDGTITRATDMHNTLNENEIQRCTSAGSQVRTKLSSSGGIFSCCASFRVQPLSPELLQPRVYPGGLLITRSFGDFYAKDPLLGGRPGSVICDPGQIRFYNLSDLKYVVLASDGVWDALDSESVFKIIDDSLSDHLVHRKLQPSVFSEEVLGLREHSMSCNLIAKRGEISYLHSAIANEVCNKAISSPFWKKLNCPADNASCVIISISNPSLTSLPLHEDIAI